VQNGTGGRERGRTCPYIKIKVVSAKGNSKHLCPQPAMRRLEARERKWGGDRQEQQTGKPQASSLAKQGGASPA